MSSTTTHRRLSTRRGSVSAPDPYGKYWESSDPFRSSSSILTIVRVVPDEREISPKGPFSLQEPPSPQRRFNSRRIGSTGNGPAEHNTSSPRLSFAKNSFNNNSSSGPSTSPSSSPHLRPSSPTQFRPSGHGRNHSGSQGKPRLSADQLYDLAKRSTDPRLTPNSAHSPYSPGKSPAHSPLPSPFISGPATSTAPASFTPLPPSIYLPFIDRPVEVSTLISCPPTERLFALLKQTFPKASEGDEDGQTKLVVANDPSSSPNLTRFIPGTSSSSHSSSSSVSSTYAGSLSDLPKEPTTWSYAQLVKFLTTAPRESVPDAIYVKKIRTCILSRSELIWERIRGALGVPDEWNDDDFDVTSEGDVLSDYDELNTSDLEDGGMKARGHWEGWDSVMDSPVYEKHRDKHSRAISDLSLGGAEEKFTAEVQGRLKTHLSHAKDDTLKAPSQAGDGDTTISPTPQQTATPPVDTSELPPSDLGDSPHFAITIEPIITSPSSQSPFYSVSPNNPPPLSLPSSLSEVAAGGAVLGDIMEGAEDEEEAANVPSSGACATKSPPDLQSGISPMQIQGLRISTSSTSPPLSPKSRPQSASSVHNGRASSFHGERLSTSTSVPRVPSPLYGEPEFAYNPVADRAPGNPLFPSNFARLAVGPTLVANNPALRSPTLPPPPRYTLPHHLPGGSSSGIHHSIYNQPSKRSHSNSSSYSYLSDVKHDPLSLGSPPEKRRSGLTTGFMALRGNRFNRDAPSESGSNDYAVTFASGSSVDGDFRLEDVRV